VWCPRVPGHGSCSPMLGGMAVRFRGVAAAGGPDVRARLPPAFPVSSSSHSIFPGWRGIAAAGRRLHRT
jgi:hypothetical protein